MAKTPKRALSRRPDMKARAMLWVRRVMTFAVVAAVLAGLALWYAARWTPDRVQYPTQGVLLSATNGDIAWGRIAAAGADFAYIAATAGPAGVDTQLDANLSGARAAGMRVGAIHRYSLCALASDQAENFIRHVPRYPDALPAVVWLDFEDGCADRPTKALVVSELTTFLAQIEAHMGKRALIAPGPAFEDKYGVTADINRTTWLRRSFFTPDYGAHPWVLWQANDLLRVGGADGTVGWIVMAGGAK